MSTKSEQQLHVRNDVELAAQFPRDFLWGAATSAYQIEGATEEDGRGLSIWDRFAATPGKTFRGETGQVAVDHYHRMEKDVELMAELGLGAYRFSISWPRIFPDGTGRVNQGGLDFYSRLVDALLAKNIQPVVTLFHWDLPAALQDQGGWTNRATADAFADYAACVVEHLGDRVSWWITHNEPWCSAYLGHGVGIHAPGIQDAQSAATAAHNILLSHGLAVPRMRALLPPDARIGISLNLFPVYKVDEVPGISERVERELDFRNRWFLDPVFKGHYPSALFSFLHCQPPEVQAGDMELISAPLDFLGINYYNPLRIGMVRLQNGHGGVKHACDVLDMSASAACTAMGWEVYPQGLTDIMSWLRQEYVVPAILITENGSAFEDSLDAKEQVADSRRLHYLREHINAIGRTIQQPDSIPVQGYFAWSLMDNYEWAEGYSKRFGLVYVDYDTQKRIIKDSGRWYASFLTLQNSQQYD
ncbi:GH1 family beta-glucosidase [Dictyobacter kobayashii]|uniref:Beta-glucosidase n=1 Tax=Dictyobacter kobayashii TaxID=2014872 RepID=A0A402AY58_9CHLR|nr:GH1 family beta-glucosidase [Dictyobacter kobayashii]GCE23994.1 beta-glucosidase [Dictyobacter kobayashii]